MMEESAKDVEEDYIPKGREIISSCQMRGRKLIMEANYFYLLTQCLFHDFRHAVIPSNHTLIKSSELLIRGWNLSLWNSKAILILLSTFGLPASAVRS